MQLGFEQKPLVKTLAEKIQDFMKENEQELYANAVTGYFTDALDDLKQQAEYEPDSREISLTIAEARYEAIDL